MASGYGLIRGNALAIPLADNSVDLVVCSPPYWALRSYQDDGEHFDGQLGSEESPAAFLEALWAVTDELWRILKPTGSYFCNLGDKYSGSGGHNNNDTHKGNRGSTLGASRRNAPDRYNQAADVRAKSLMGLPWRYALGLSCPDGYRPGGGPQWVLRAEIIWDKPNGLPESVTDRVRRSHEQWFHFTKEGRYFAAVDEVREPHARIWDPAKPNGGRNFERGEGSMLGRATDPNGGLKRSEPNALGKLPGSVWSVPSEPLAVPDHLGVDHFACVDEATEIFTDRGWLRHHELVEGDTVAGYNLDLGRAEWTTCHGIHRYDYHGPLVAVDKRGLSMRLTPNHRVLAQKRIGRDGRRSPMQVIRADELTAAHYIPQASEWAPFEHKAIGEDLAALIGWVTAEGWLSNGQVRLSQSLTANPQKVATIDAILERIILPPADRSARKTYRKVLDVVKRTTQWRDYRGTPKQMVTWALPLGLSQELLRLVPGNLLTWEMVGLPENERRLLLDAFIDGDGHRRPDGRIGIFQKDRHNLDVLQAIAVTLGYRTRLGRQSAKFALYLTTGERSLTLRGTNGALEAIPTEHHDGIVWCPSTGTGTFIARRDGKVFITGNSYPQELPRRLILGWSPAGICVKCNEGRRPMVEKKLTNVWHDKPVVDTKYENLPHRNDRLDPAGSTMTTYGSTEATITGYACACDVPIAPTRPAVCFDPFVGTGTTVGVARALGRFGVGLDLSGDYLRLATWRISRSGHFAKTTNRTNRERQGALWERP